MSDSPIGDLEHKPSRHLLPYGVGGDYIGARRFRRAFRLAVLACVGITLSLYISENYLRYGLSETQFRMALSHEDDSQRAILREVVNRDRRDSEVPTARYVAALAYIEEKDIVLERFAEAVELAPDDGDLLIVYGCKLFQMGEFKEARRIFREAGLKSGKNALPDYLLAAAIAASSTSEEDFRTAVALVSRTNDSGNPVLFPQPLWHESLPKDGYWYADLRRKLADLCCAPIYSLKDVVLQRVREEMDGAGGQSLETWLYQLQRFGKKLIGAPLDSTETLNTSVMIVGLKLQQDALNLRVAFQTQHGDAASEELRALQGQLSEAMAQIVRFETQREDSRSKRIGEATLSVWLVFLGMLMLGSAAVMLSILSRIVHTDRNSRAVRQSRTGLRLLACWAGALALCLIWATLGSGIYSQPELIVGLWSSLMVAIVLVAVVYPALLLPREATVCTSLVSEPGYAELLQEARRARRRAYFSLAGRFMTLALGTYICLVCFWVVGFRVLSGLYPTDIKLLVSGLLLEEQSLIQQIQGMF